MHSQSTVKEFSVERHLRRRRMAHQTDVSNGELLEAIEALQGELAGLREMVHAGGTAAAVQESPQSASAGLSGETGEELAARVEIAQMVQAIGRAKMEIASIKHPKSDDDRMSAATSELDAIVLATETSTEDILNASETIENLVRKISGLCHDNDVVVSATDEIAEEIIKIFEACNFQDITGQRITKVINTIRFIEERILAMISIWGVEAFTELPVPKTEGDDSDEALMNGPALGGQGISQEDINALFD